MQLSPTIGAHLPRQDINIGSFEPLQVLVVDGDERSSSSLQQKLQELSYEGTALAESPSGIGRAVALATTL